eukprot:TRINITY_DN5281_c0_g2_i2.p1 TRINITY_DN5281_c0_g2~~TRINITY_DN5281_c0_g2_i2.p1  ORF type:complete len:212 (+),score=16.83 TRINITY_DN5281_c0_g2_i2:247-882(+)
MCPRTKNLHFQIFVEWSTRTRFQTIQRAFGDMKMAKHAPAPPQASDFWKNDAFFQYPKGLVSVPASLINTFFSNLSCQMRHNGCIGPFDQERCTSAKLVLSFTHTVQLKNKFGQVTGREEKKMVEMFCTVSSVKELLSSLLAAITDCLCDTQGRTVAFGDRIMVFQRGQTLCVAFPELSLDIDDAPDIVAAIQKALNVIRIGHPDHDLVQM